jgi:hypothetical protein
LATLRGHLEAGQIEFRARDLDDGADGPVEFEIESWARAADRLSHVLYNRLRLAKEIQLNLWLETCLRLAALGGGHPRDGVHVDTRRIADLGGSWTTPAVASGGQVAASQGGGGPDTGVVSGPTTTPRGGQMGAAQ